MENSTETSAGKGVLPGLINQATALFGRIPDTLIAMIARFSIAGVFWKSGQTKIEGLAIDVVSGEFSLGYHGCRTARSFCSRRSTVCR